MAAEDFQFFDQDFSKNLKFSANFCLVDEKWLEDFEKTVVFRRSHAGNDPINNIDPTGLKVVDPDGVIPDWIKQTPLYKKLDGALALIVVRNKDLTGEDAFGQTNGIAFGRIQTVDIDVAANAGRDSSMCSRLNGLEDTILHEFNHANQNLSRYAPNAGSEAQDNLLLPSLLSNYSAYKK